MRTQYLRWSFAVIALVGLLSTACSSTASLSTTHEKASVVDKANKTVKLSMKAHERLGIQTEKLSEEQIVRTRRIGAEIVGAAPGSISTGKWARVSFNPSDLSAIDPKQPVLIFPIDGDAKNHQGIKAEVDPEREGFVSPLTPNADKYLYFKINDETQSPKIGERVRVEVKLNGSNGSRKLIPYSAVIYDVKGATWVYVNLDSLSYQRQPIKIDFVDNDVAYMVEGPTNGTPIVTRGVAELYGAETGVGK
jgi:hypothetical protein